MRHMTPRERREWLRLTNPEVISFDELFMDELEGSYCAAAVGDQPDEWYWIYYDLVQQLEYEAEAAEWRAEDSLYSMERDWSEIDADFYDYYDDYYYDNSPSIDHDPYDDDDDGWDDYWYDDEYVAWADMNRYDEEAELLAGPADDKADIDSYRWEMKHNLYWRDGIHGVPVECQRAAKRAARQDFRTHVAYEYLGKAC